MDREAIERKAKEAMLDTFWLEGFAASNDDAQERIRHIRAVIRLLSGGMMP